MELMAPPADRRPLWRQLLSIKPPAGPVAAATFALVVLSALYFFDEFDTAAFGVLAPDIKRSFHISTATFTGLVVANVSLVLILAIPVGYLADRVRRAGLVVLSGILAGAFSFATGLVGSVALLTLVRFGNGLGLLANGPIHNSLIADEYEPTHRGAAFAYHLNAVQLGAIVGPAVAGGAGAVFGWRAAFFILFVPIIAVSMLATRIREPLRGQTDDPASASLVEQERPVAFKEGVRHLWTVRTLRRQFYGSIFFGAGLLPLAAYLPLYLDETFHVSALGRGAVGSIDAVATYFGIRLGGQLTLGWFAKGMGHPIKMAARSLAVTGIGLAVVAASPWLPLVIVLGLGTSFVIGTFQAPYYATQALVSPARVRTFSFSFGSLFLVAGVILFYVSGLATVADSDGIRWGIFVLCPFWLIAALYLYTSSRFVADDASRALATLATTARLREQRRSAGERTLLLCSGVDVAYDSVQVLFGVDFELVEGEIVALLGTNGAGKSTLLRAISGLVDPIGGSIFFDGEDVTHADPRRCVQLGIIQMPGGRSIFPTLTVAESLRLASWLYKRQDPAHVRAATAAVLAAFPVLEERSNQLAGNLSGGEQQMLGLGMALIAKPRLLMIDELSLGLAPAIVGQLVDIVRQIHAQGTTVVLVEQSVNIALTLAQRAVFMEKGEVRFSGPTSELLHREDILRSVFLEGVSSLSGSGAVARASAAVVSSDRPTVLELDGVVKRFSGIRAVDGASFSLTSGEILGLIGPNGAGKTTIFDLISGFLIPDSGRVVFEGADITQWSPERRSWAGLGRSFQDARLFPSLTVTENIAVALERHLPFRDPLAAALGLPAVAEAEESAQHSVDELVELLGLGAYRNKFVRELSTGSRRIVDLAMSIAHRPSVLILDEPSSGIAQRETEALGPLLLRIRDETSCSLLVIEHDMPLITSVADRLVALELGAVIATGTPEEVVHHPDVVASYLGGDSSMIARSGALSELAPTNGSTNGASRRASRARAAVR